jgi:hypothetical protein
VKDLVDVGITSDMAIDRVYVVYGAQTSVTKIINAIIDDKKRDRLNPHLVMCLFFVFFICSSKLCFVYCVLMLVDCLPMH